MGTEKKNREKQNENAMKRKIALIVALVLVCGSLWAQEKTNSPKRERKKNLVVKEWNTRSGSKMPYLDNQLTYDGLGRKIEEVEYASYGQKSRTTYEYEGESTKCSRQIEYDDKNKVKRIKKFEYNEDGTKKRQYNYTPNGKLESVKDFEYSYR